MVTSNKTIVLQCFLNKFFCMGKFNEVISCKGFETTKERSTSNFEFSVSVVHMHTRRDRNHGRRLTRWLDCGGASHYRNSLLCRAPEALPSVFFSGTRQRRLCRELNKKHSAKPLHSAKKALLSVK
jgi:hypothetical protein